MTTPHTIDDKTAVEKTTPRLVYTVQDDSNPPVGIPGSSLDAATLQVFDEETGTVLTASPPRNIKGDIDSNGDGETRLTQAELTIVDDTKTIEWHVAHIEWQYDSGDGFGATTVRFPVRNLVKTT